MKKSRLMGVIAVLITLNLLIFSCQNENSTTTKKSEVAEKPIADDDKNDEADTEALANEAEENKEDAASAEETAMDEKAETAEETTKKTETKEKPVVQNTPAAPPKPKKTTPKKPATPVAKFKFDKKEYNFGTVAVGTKVEHDFYFTNVGEVPMVITDANSTCGCTIPEIPKEPIPPGGRSKVKVTFDSTGKIGMQDKHVTITANTYPKNTVIHMKGLALTENMMPKKSTTASPSPYSSPKLTEPASTSPAKNEDTKLTDNSDSGSSMIPTADKPNVPSADNKNEMESNTTDTKDNSDN